MPASELTYIALCKRKIEEKFFSNRRPTQRDLDALSALIETKTGVLLSLSTLKRFWGGHFKQSPQVATLNALANVLEYEDWQDFKSKNSEVASISRPFAPRSAVITGLGIIAAVSVIAFSLISGSSPQGERRRPALTGPLEFRATKTVGMGVPTTVFFKYDVSHVDADTFYIQQSWNKDHRVVIDPGGSAISSIYYESGYHKAKLIAGDSVIATQPVHILSNGWEPHLYRSDSDPELVDLKNERYIDDGILRIHRDILIKRGIDFTKRFHTRITNSRAFHVSSDNFRFSTRMKADSVFNEVCGWMDLIIVTEAHAFSVSWTAKGCEKYAAYKLGEVLKKGDTHDLSALGRNIFQWQDLEIRVTNRHAEIFLNGEKAFVEDYLQDHGQIMSLIYIFDGTGSIDYARLEDINGRTALEENF